MYGKERIVIQKNNQIVLAGGRSWFPIGLVVPYPYDTKQIRAKIVKELHSQHDGFEWIYASTQKGLRELINEKFNWIKESNG